MIRCEYCGVYSKRGEGICTSCGAALDYTRDFVSALLRDRMRFATACVPVDVRHVSWGDSDKPVSLEKLKA